MTNLKDPHSTPDLDDKYFLKAKKSLAQHFLRSEKALNTMIESIGLDSQTIQDSELSRSKVVFEIGPGEGVLTEKLLDQGYTVIVVEIDKRSIKLLRDRFAKQLENNKLFIVEKDCLDVDYAEELKNLPMTISYKEYILLGNIPYYITGAIFRNTFEQKLLPISVTFLIQKEVAQRIVANDKKESLLSVSVKIFTSTNVDSITSKVVQNVKILDIVKAGSFVPPPKVDSAIISINNITSPFANKKSGDVFFKILRAAFSHKRKFLLTNIKTDLEKDLYDKYFPQVEKIILANCPAKEKTRAEDVSVSVWKQIILAL